MTIFRVLFLVFGALLINESIAQNLSTIRLVESAGGCVLQSDCPNDILCFDIMLTPGYNGEVLSYNITLQYLPDPFGTPGYPNTGLSYLSNMACITNTGALNQLENTVGGIRVSGVQGTTPVQIGVEVALHTVCFDASNIIDSSDIIVGYPTANLSSPITFNNPSNNDPDLDPNTLEINAGTVTCGILPVEYLYFDAEAFGNMAKLDWATATEINNERFDIYHSMDGQNFLNIGSVKGQGNKVSNTKYNYLHRTPSTGNNYYFLKQIDFDGNSSNSELKVVNLNRENRTFSIYPNPVKDVINLAATSENSKDEYKIVIHNSTGQIVKEFTSRNSTTIDIKELVGGIYNFVVKDKYNNTLFAEKFIKVN